MESIAITIVFWILVCCEVLVFGCAVFTFWFSIHIFNYGDKLTGIVLGLVSFGSFMAAAVIAMYIFVGAGM